MNTGDDVVGSRQQRLCQLARRLCKGLLHEQGVDVRGLGSGQFVLWVGLVPVNARQGRSFCQRRRRSSAVAAGDGRMAIDGIADVTPVVEREKGRFFLARPQHVVFALGQEE